MNNFLSKQYHVPILFIFLLKRNYAFKTKIIGGWSCFVTNACNFSTGFIWVLKCSVISLLELNYELKSLTKTSPWLKNLSSSLISIFADIRKSTFWSIKYIPVVFPGWWHYLLSSLNPTLHFSNYTVKLTGTSISLDKDINMRKRNKIR